jgi:hypothetical protein
MMRGRLLGLCLVACQAEAPRAEPVASAADPSTEERRRTRVLGFFDDVADRVVEAVQQVSSSKPKSRVAYVEALALATPAAMPLHADLAEKWQTNTLEVAAAMLEPGFQEAMLKNLQPRLESAMKEVTAQSLAEVDATDCTRLARRLVELTGEGRTMKGMLAVLAPAFLPCAPVLPPEVAACQPTGPTSLAAYDACVATRAPAP